MANDELSQIIVKVIADKNGWDLAVAKEKITRVKQILRLQTLEDAAAFLLSAQSVGKPPASPVIQILDIARGARRSPKEIYDKWDDGGSCRTHKSIIADEVWKILETLPKEDRPGVLEAAEACYQLLLGDPHPYHSRP